METSALLRRHLFCILKECWTG